MSDNQDVLIDIIKRLLKQLDEANEYLDWTRQQYASCRADLAVEREQVDELRAQLQDGETDGC